jgi:hypothetical protein
VGVATGAAGAASRESPLLAQFRATNQYLTDTYLKTLQKVAEAQRGITAFGPRSGLGGGGGVAAGGGPILDPYGRPARPLDDVALPTSRTTGPSLSQRGHWWWCRWRSRWWWRWWWRNVSQGYATGRRGKDWYWSSV